jgi:hypothetical protein
MKNIIFFSSTAKKPSGGVKIIHQFSNYINSLNGFSSSVIQLEKKKIFKWIESIKKKINIKTAVFTGWKFKELKNNKNNKLTFNNKNDFIILPEIFAHFAEDFLLKNKIPYAIFVQNGYNLFPTNDTRKINLAYRKAKFILSYSKDIDDCVSMAFPKIRNKILNVIPSVDSKKINLKSKKLNLITYMPRKLPKHSELIILFLQKLLPSGWKIKPIHNLSEFKVFKILAQSKIFLSFSELEGLGLPPIEAALAGNKVIGYTGEAGKEYWKKPIFTEIDNGNIKKFCKEILDNLKTKDFVKNTRDQRKKLAIKYSFSNEKLSIKKFLKKI